MLSPVLAAVNIACICALAALRIGEGPSALVLGGQIVLVFFFIALAVLDFRAAAAIAIVELVLGGTGGRWTEFALGLSGRLVLDGILMVRAATLVLERSRGRRVDLGPYGRHALALAIVLPIVWMTLGLANGNTPNDVFADGNGTIFFAFILVLIALIRQGAGQWLRRWLFIACAINALLTGVLVLASASGWIALRPTLERVLLVDFDMGGVVGYMPNGAYRLYLGSGLFLQVGLALTTWLLLRRPGVLLLWLLYALLCVDVAATYTRGFWIGAALAVLVVLALGSDGWRMPAAVVAATIALFAGATGLGRLVDFSVPDYVLARTISTVRTEAGAGPSDLGNDLAGTESNHIRLVQAKVLWRHIQDRPVIGYGFGAVAADYPYGHSYAYELSYLHLLFKVGILGTLLFLSFHLRILIDALRARLRRLWLPDGVSPREASVVIAIVSSLLLTGASNPYFLAAFGIFPVLACVAWLEPDRVSEGGRECVAERRSA